MNIDEILERAETTEDLGENPNLEILNAFKVADFAPKSTSPNAADESDPDYWKKVIPASMIEANDKSKEEVNLLFFFLT
jgi:hypothetical protein